MIPIMEFQERSLKGPVKKPAEFDLAYAKKVRELVGTYEIRYDPEELIVSDTTADAVFQAGVELLAAVGLFHLDTQRVITFTAEELKQVATAYREDPPRQTFGQGADEITVTFRTAEDPTPPVLAGGAAGSIEEAWFVPYVQSFAQEKTNRALGIAGGIASVGGVVPKAGTLSEMTCGLWECGKLAEVLRNVGRPGLHLGLLCTVSTVGAIMSCIRPGLREPHNTQIGIHIIPELKMDWARLQLALFCQDRGITPWTSAMSMVGALNRNGAEAAVGIVANLLGQLSYGHGTLASLFSNHLDGRWADAETQWAFSGAARASERNIRIPVAGVCGGMERYWRTEAGMWQAASMAVSNTASGFAYAWIAGHTGLESRLVGETMNALAGMERGKANALLKAVLATTDEKLKACSGPRSFPEAYDPETVRPRPELVKDYDRVKEALAKLGVPFA
jgi:methylamine---corrinoid protein Co-methyltransferase